MPWCGEVMQGQIGHSYHRAPTEIPQARFLCFTTDRNLYWSIGGVRINNCDGKKTILLTPISKRKRIQSSLLHMHGVPMFCVRGAEAHFAERVIGKMILHPRSHFYVLASTINQDKTSLAVSIPAGGFRRTSRCTRIAAVPITSVHTIVAHYDMNFNNHKGKLTRVIAAVTRRRSICLEIVVPDIWRTCWP